MVIFSLILLAFMLGVPFTAQAKQTRFEIVKQSKQWSFDVHWKDHGLKPHRVEFSLPEARIQNDLSVPLRFDQRAANLEVVRAINAYGETFQNVQLKARMNPAGKLDVRARGPVGPTQKAMNGVKRVQTDAMQSYMKRNGFAKLKGKVIPNHVRYVRLYAQQVAPLARAMGAGDLNRRQFAARALSYVQSIPYEKGRNGSDKGFRPPLSVLAQNRGDCDSKAVLYLALLRAAHPKTETAMVYMKGHAFVGLGIPVRQGDVGFSVRGEEWLIAEPVGPAQTPLGDAARHSKRKARQGRISMRHVKSD